MAVLIEEGEDASVLPGGAYTRAAAQSFAAAALALSTAALELNSQVTFNGDQETASGLYLPREEWDNGQPGNLNLPRFAPNAIFQALPYRSLLADDQSENASGLYRTIDEYHDTQTIGGNLSPPRFVPTAFFQTLPWNLARDPDETPAGSLFGLYDDTDLWRSQNVIPPWSVPFLVFQVLPYLSGDDIEDAPVGFFFGQYDEHFYTLNGWPVRAMFPPAFGLAALQLLPYLTGSDVEDVPAGALFGLYDDTDLWRSQVNIVPRSVPLLVFQPLPFPWTDAEDLPAAFFFAQADEDFRAWPNAGPPFAQGLLVFQLLPYLTGADVEDIPVGKLFGQYDEHFFSPNISPPFAQGLLVFQPLPYRSGSDVEDLPTSFFFGQYDDSIAATPLPWVFIPPRIILDTEDARLPQAAVFTPDDDGRPVLFTWPTTSVPQPLQDVDDPTTVLQDSDAWQPTAFSSPAFALYSPPSDEVSSATQISDDTWQVLARSLDDVRRQTWWIDLDVEDLKEKQPKDLIISDVSITIYACDAADAGDLVATGDAAQLRYAIGDPEVWSPLTIDTQLEGGNVNTIVAGTRVRISCTFKDFTGALTDVSVPGLKVVTTRNGGVVTTEDMTSSIVHDGLGAYHVDYLASFAGAIRYEWSSTGGGEEVRAVTGTFQAVLALS